MAASGLTIIQINLHHSKSASAVLQKSIAVMHTGISLIQEPWINKDVIRRLEGTNIYCYRYPEAPNPRTCILAKNINIVPLLDLCTRDLMVASVDLIGIGKLVIGSAYFPHDSVTHPPEEVRSLVDYCKVRGLPLLLGCDANSHHKLWGSTDTNRRGEDLVDYLITTDLDILNTGTVPTFRNSVREEVIDITLCTGSFRDKVKKWRVSDEPSLSDHMQILYELESHAPSGPTWVRNPRKTNWERYSTGLQAALHGKTMEIKDVDALERAADQFSSAIITTYELNCLPSEIKKARETHWWNGKLEKLRKETRERFRRAKKGNTEELWNLSNATRDAYRKEIREAKNKSWTSFCSDIEKGAEAARLNRLLARNPGAMLSTLKLPDGTYSESDRETLTLLTMAHFPGFKGPTEVGWSSQKGRPLPATQLGLRGRLAREIASPARVRWALKSFNPYKSPGPDGIYPVLLQRAGDPIIGPLVRLARASLTLGYVPKAWRGTRVIFIPKAGKNGWTSPKDFRPISLTSFVLKTVERLVDRYIRDKILTVKPLHSDQHAYRAGHSTETALSKAVNLIEDQMNLKGFAIGTFMDIEGAFNHTSSEVIRRAMIRQGVPIAVVDWTCHMLGNRNITITKGNTTLQGIVDSGCPQGGVLSPLLWSLVVDELLHLLTDQGCHPIGYADDILVIVRGMHLDALMGVMQQSLKAVDT